MLVFAFFVLAIFLSCAFYVGAFCYFYEIYDAYDVYDVYGACDVCAF